MTMQRYQLMVDFVASDVARWYDKATDADTAVIARAVSPAVWLFRLPYAQVYWWTEGGRGLTVSLDEARQRLAMVQEGGWLGRPSSSSQKRSERLESGIA